MRISARSDLSRGDGAIFSLNSFNKAAAVSRRSSERVFWRKVLDICVLSEDYDPQAETSKRFFQTVQNKLRWAIHGHSAAEIVHARADAVKANMGLTSWTGACFARRM